MKSRASSRFTKICKIAKNRKSDDFLRYLRFFAVLCPLNNHQTRPSCGFSKIAKIAKNRKFDDFSRYLRFLAVLCHVNVHFSRVHDHLKKAVCRFSKFAMSSKSFRFTCHFGIFLSAQLRHIYTQKPTQPVFKYSLVMPSLN